MKYKSFLPLMLTCLTMTNPVISQTTLSGSYNESVHLSLNNSPYLVVDSAVFEGPDLRIDRGVIITFKFHPDSERKSYMRIRSHITLPEHDGDPPSIIFTSDRDNSPYDLNGDEEASRPSPGDWGYVLFDPGNPADYVVNLDYLTFRYGGGRALSNQTDESLFPMTNVSDYNEAGRHEERIVFFRCNFTQSAGVGFSAGMGILDECLVSTNNHGIQIRTSDALLKNTLISKSEMYPVYLIDPLIKRDDIDMKNSVIDWFFNNQLEGNAVNAIALEGTISQAHDDKDPSRWTYLQNFGLPYLITNDLIIDSLDLFVESGTLVKFLPEAYTGKALNIVAKNSGTLNAYTDVIFTSLHDYTHDPQPPERIEAGPVAGDWGIISTEMPLMLGATFKYGGKYVSSLNNQILPDSSAVLQITGPRKRGITSIGYNPWGEIEGCVFQKLYLHGIQVALPDPGSTTVSISGNSFFLDQNSYGIRTHWKADQGNIEISAQGNYWNSSKGPYHPELNAQGNGCKVDDYVSFSDYLSSPEKGDPQEYSTLRGIVSDSEGKPVVKAAVTLLSKSPQTVYTSEKGLYYLSGIKPGSGYELSVRAKAFRAVKVSPLDIPADTSLLLDPFSLEKLSIDYAIDRSYFQINPAESTVGVGGTAHRYYRIVDIHSKEPVYGVEVLVPGVDTFYSDTKGIVDVAIPATTVGNANSSKTFEILRIGLETLDLPLDKRETFTVNVRPYKYRKVWSGSTFIKIGAVSLEAQKEQGAAIDLHMKDVGSGAIADSIRMVRQSRLGFGANQEASAKIELGPMEAGAEAGVGVNLNSIFEDDFKFDYPNSTGPQALAKFIVMADGALPYMSASLTRYFIAALERQVDDIDEAALSNAIGMNLHGYASAEASLGLNLFEESDVPAALGAEITGSASLTGDITYMARRDAHKDPVTDLHPLDLGFHFATEIKGEAGASLGLDLDKLFGKKEGDDDAPVQLGFDLPFEISGENGLDLGKLEASGSLKFGYHFGTRRFAENPFCKLGFMYGYSYTLEKGRLGKADGISENREINYSFHLYDSEIIETVAQSTELASSMLSTDNLLNLNITDLTSGKFFNNPMNSIAYQQSRNSFSLAPVPYQKTISDQVDDGNFKISINVGFSVVSAKFGAGFKYKEVNTYRQENGLFYDWNLYPLESYEFLENNEEYKARLIVQDIVSTSANYLVDEVKKKLIPPIFRKIKIWPFNKKSAATSVPIGPDTRSSQLVFADSSTVFSIEGIDSLDVIYWDWYGTGEESSLKKAASKPNLYALNEYVKKSATRIHKLDYGIGGFYQFEPYNVSVGDNQVDVVINYFEEELLVLLNDSSSYRIREKDLRMYKEDQEQNKWIFIGGVVDTIHNTVKARIDAFGTFTLAPFIPSGTLQLMASMDSIMPAGAMLPEGSMMPEGSMTSTMIQSANLIYNTDVQVRDGELYTLKASRGTFAEMANMDADTSREGLQVAAMGGMIQATYMADSLTGDVRIIAESVVGDARGSIDIFVYDSLAPQAPLLSGVRMMDEEVNLHWQPGSEEDITGYLVHFDTLSGGPYQGTASVFGDASPVNAGLDSTINLAGLSPGKQYYFSITAIDRCGNTSEYSNELSVFTEINHRPVFYHRVIHIEPDLVQGTVIDTLLARDEDEEQILSFYFTDQNQEDAFALDPASGVLRVANSKRLNYFTTRIDTFLLQVGVVDNASEPARDEGLVLVVMDVDTWVPSYQDEQSASLELYPNPAREYITVKLGESALKGRVSLAIYGSDGRRHFSSSYEHIRQYEIRLPVDQLKEGVYHVVLESESDKRIGKLVILE